MTSEQRYWTAVRDCNHVEDRLQAPCLACCTAAILAHAEAVREEAARIAKSEKSEVGPNPTPGEYAYDEGYSQASDNIAAAIWALKVE